MKSPARDELGNFRRFRDMEYDNWFDTQLRKMKDVNILRYKCLNSKAKNYDEMRFFCRSRRGSNSSISKRQ